MQPSPSSNDPALAHHRRPGRIEHAADFSDTRDDPDDLGAARGVFASLAVSLAVLASAWWLWSER